MLGFYTFSFCPVSVRCCLPALPRLLPMFSYRLCAGHSLRGIAKAYRWAEAGGRNGFGCCLSRVTWRQSKAARRRASRRAFSRGTSLFIRGRQVGSALRQHRIQRHI